MHGGQSLNSLCHKMWKSSSRHAAPLRLQPLQRGSAAARRAPASCYHKRSILASRLGAGGATQGPVPGSGRTGAPSTRRLPRRAAFVGQKPLLHGHASRVAAQGSAAADHSVARDEDGDLENSEAAAVSLGSGPAWPFGIWGKAPDHDGPRAQLAGLGHGQAPSQHCSPLGL